MAARTKGQAPLVELTSGSVEETRAFGERLGRLLRPGDVVALEGELGSGKTTLIQGIAQGMDRDPGTVKSPTFVLVREYPGAVPIVHVDGYRLEPPATAASLDVELLFAPHKVTLIEWAERFAGLLPEERLVIRMGHVSANRRRLSLAPSGERPQAIVRQMASTHGPAGD
ncbi:MAG: tRNA (adenosine(37)-N6)-threonylcarbamoyltransferase complex ATPase subunit type 1 TsaE [Candidatus Omnitrophica bacterium]|nr:tRNA (adenosine(37)-N6)-threonylcarbamoyltransferase complex ATPase subunit type 1 TsaE [Candidatus Omnitrophota bacterium]